MSKNYKQKLKKITFIFLIIGVLAVAAAISYDRIKQKIYLNRASGFLNAMIGKRSWYRPKFDELN